MSSGIQDYGQRIKVRMERFIAVDLVCRPASNEIHHWQHRHGAGVQGCSELWFVLKVLQTT